MSQFDQWWKDNADGGVQTPLMKACFYGGYLSALQSVLRVLTAAAIVCLVVVALTGCEDQYRYPCQNPDNFQRTECQKPKCQFTQQCPEYLVAPILEKQINAQPAQPTPEASPQR
jgi:hypothetical protein